MLWRLVLEAVTLGAPCILAEPPVAVVDKVVDKHGTRKLAEAYLKYLYSDEGQQIAARNRGAQLLSSTLGQGAGRSHEAVPEAQALHAVDDTFGGWTKGQKTHFADGGVFDSIYQPQ